MITERDCEIVEALDRAGGLEATSLRVMFGLGHGAVYRRLGQLERHGVIRSARPFPGAVGLYVPTRRGAREVLGMEHFEPPVISSTSYGHQVEVGRVLAQLQARGLPWESARITRRRRLAALADGDYEKADRHVLKLPFPRGTHLPDALIWPSETARVHDRPVAIEVELALKTRTRLDAIIGGYVQSLGLRGVVYVCGPRSHRAVREAAERCVQPEIANITTLDEFGPGIDLPARSGRRKTPTRGQVFNSWMDRYLTPGLVSALEECFVDLPTDFLQLRLFD